MYNTVVASVRTNGGIISEFHVTSFASRICINPISLCTRWAHKINSKRKSLYAYDIGIVDETRTEVNVKLEIWFDTLESKRAFI